MNKAFITNLLAGLLVVFSFVLPVAQAQIFSVGIFALSGAVTNWLAIHMLFERVPLLYGSGVIPNRFEEFKAAIKTMVMQQFFNHENIQRFIAEEEEAVATWLKPGRLIDAVNYDTLFQRLVDAIMESSFGSMLGMFGGASALDKLREPFIVKIKETLNEMVNQDSFKRTLAASVDSEQLSTDLRGKIEGMVDQRLEELTPQIVKQMVQEMIKQHLGWLVVWGGVFGGLIGLLVSFL